MAIYENGAPFHYAHGVEDGSAVALKPVPKKVVHCQPLVFMNTPKGEYGEINVIGGELQARFGFDAVSPLSNFFNHQSMFALRVLGKGGQLTVRRTPFMKKPTNVTDDGIARAVLYSVTNKDAISSYPLKRDPVTGKGIWTAGDWEVDDTATANEVFFQTWTVRYHTALEVKVGLPTITITDGFTKDGTTVDAVLSPVFVLPAKAHGKFYNNIGFKMYPLTGASADIDMIKKKNNFPFAFGLVDKSSGAEKVIKTIDSSTSVKFTFHPNAQHPVTGQSVTLEDLIPKKFGNVTNTEYDLIPFEIDKPTFNRDVMSTMSSTITQREADLMGGTFIPWIDFDEFDSASLTLRNEEIKYIANILSATWSNGAPYEMTRMSDNIILSAEAVTKCGKVCNLTEDTPIYLINGEDGYGAENVVEYEANVLRELALYADGDAEETHLALSTISEFVDTGFTFDTKMHFGVFNSFRTDVRLIGAVEEVNVNNNTLSVEESISKGALLNAMYAMSIESETFNTPNMRTCILIGSGNEKAGFYRYNLPASYDFALKNVNMFKGAKWNMVYEFSTQPNNVVDDLVDVTPRTMPNSLRNKAWDTGLIWLDAVDLQKVYYPQMQSIYPDDTSINNAWYTSVAVCYVEKMLALSHRERTGDQTSSPTQQISKMQEKIDNYLIDKFGGIVIPTVEVYKTPRDEAAGYAVTAKVTIKSGVMFTVLNSGILTIRK